MTGRLDGIDLVIFDKDGTLIEFHAMWSGWAIALADGLERATGRPIRETLYAMLGYDAAAGRRASAVDAWLRPRWRGSGRRPGTCSGDGRRARRGRGALDAAWHAPDPVALARPVTDLGALLTALRARRTADRGRDDRRPRAHPPDPDRPRPRRLHRCGRCADDGIAVKPAGDMVVHLCRLLGTPPDRTVVVGDSPADLAMGRAAGVARCYGVLTGVGTRDELAPIADEVIDNVADLLGG